MSSLWRENVGIALCHSCSREIEPERQKLKRTRCFSCAKLDAAASKRWRQKRRDAWQIRIAALIADHRAEIARLSAEGRASLADATARGALSCTMVADSRRLEVAARTLLAERVVRPKDDE